MSISKIIMILVIIVLGWALYSYSISKNTIIDKMDNINVNNNIEKNEVNNKQITDNKNKFNSDTNNIQIAKPEDLLPQDPNSNWGTLNPVEMNNGQVVIPDLLQAGYHIGLDTIGQSLKNANQQLRSDPIIEKVNIGPWNQSTIDPDLGRVPLEIGTQ